MSKNFLDSNTLEKFKGYFLEIIPELINSRKEILSNLISQAKSSDIDNYLSGHIVKCNDLEKQEKSLEEYIPKIKGYRQLDGYTKRINNYIMRLSRAADRCKDPVIVLKIKKINLPSREFLKGYVIKSAVNKGSTLPGLNIRRATPINKLAANVTGKLRKK